MHLMRRFVTGGMALLASTFAVVSAPAAYATSGSALTMTPPPPPSATCKTTGSGIFCDGDYTFSDNFDTGISCGTPPASFDVLVSDTGTTSFRLHYSSVGLALEGTFHVNSQGTFINSVTGKTIGNDAHFSQTFDFATPGDPSTATRTITGAFGIATGKSIGLVAHDVGKIVFDPSGNILFEGGPHNALDNFPAFVQAICSALS